MSHDCLRRPLATFALLIAVGAAVPGLAQDHAADTLSLPIAVGGQAAACIVIPPDPPHPVRFAAEELKRFLDRRSGGSFTITSDMPTQGTVLVLGEKLAAGAGIRVADLTRDGYRVQTVGRRVYIAGVDDRTETSRVLFTVYDGPLPPKAPQIERHRAFGDIAWDFERGTLHGVYHLLELLGVRWFFPGPKGEVVPRSADLALPALNLREEPHFLLRISGQVIFPNPTYIKRGVFDPEEYAELGWNGRNQRLWTVRQRWSSQFMAFNHRPKRHQWSRRFAREHPEYFALQKDGTRALGLGKGERAYLNYTNPGVFEETMRDIDAFCSGQPASVRGMQMSELFAPNNGWEPRASYRDTFSLLPNDGLRVDRSEASLPFIHEDMPFPHRHTDYVWQFVDRVARAAESKHPGTFFTCLAYQTYWEIPQCVSSLPDNVIVGIAALSGASRMCTSVNEDAYREFLDLVERWSRMSKAPMLFWHYSLYRHNQGSLKGVPMLLPHHAGRVFRDLAKHGRYLFMQNDFDNVMFEHINRYVYLRLMWNPQADVEALLDDYVSSFYGPAAALVKRVLDDIETRCMAIAGVRADAIAIWESHFTAEAMQMYRSAFDEAARATEGTPHAEAVELMSRRFIGAMESRRQAYVKDIKALRDQGADILTVRRARRAITIDGKLDEPEWRRTGGKHLRNNVDGKGTKLSARMRVRYTSEHLYCSYEIKAPAVRDQLDSGESKDFVEVFLDVDADRYSYHWLMVRLTGEVTAHFYPGPGEPPDVGWDSGAQVAVQLTDDGWCVEMAIPFAGLQAEPARGETAGWTGNFCLTRFAARDTNDMFSSVNPLLRGRFHNPGLFARFVFEE